MTSRLMPWEKDLNLTLSATWTVACFNEVTSTMDIAKELTGSGGLNSPGLVLARRQTTGRGRAGRVWSDPGDGFLATYIFETPLSPERLSGFSLVVGLAVSETLAHFGVQTKLKWPNDILDVEGAKIGGILIELAIGEGAIKIYCGIGVNLGGVPEGVSGSNSVFSLSTKEVSAVAFATELSPRLLESVTRFTQQGFLPFKKSWEAHACWRGEEVQFEESGSLVRGIFEGIDNDGALLIKSGEEVHRVLSGDVVRFRRSGEG